MKHSPLKNQYHCLLMSNMVLMDLCIFHFKKNIYKLNLAECILQIRILI